jgi:excisionase family DNA binding protein
LTDLALTIPDELIEEIAERAADILEQRGVTERAEGPGLLNIPEAAELLRCKRQRVDDLLSAGQLTRVKEGGRTLVRRSELLDRLK